jgi:hypothetical protein
MTGRGDALVVDARQLVRIEAVHRGFLYQHLYAVACLLLATKGGATEIVVEHDEDVEIVLPEGRIYVQVKTRSESLAFGDIEGAMLRFAAVRGEYEAGRRTGKPLFVIAANVPPGPKLAARLSEDAWAAARIDGRASALCPECAADHRGTLRRRCIAVLCRA